MSDNKLTDSEIVKAFECCNISGLCNECPVKRNVNVCNTIDNLVVDLINRLQEENENPKEKNSNLISDLTSLQNDLTSLRAENERLEKNLETETNHITRLENQIERLLQRLKTAKAEAYKEVAEMIDKITWYHINKNGELVQGANSKTNVPLYKAKDIHNLLKELTGE